MRRGDMLSVFKIPLFLLGVSLLAVEPVPTPVCAAPAQESVSAQARVKASGAGAPAQRKQKTEASGSRQRKTQATAHRASPEKRKSAPEKSSSHPARTAARRTQAEEQFLPSPTSAPPSQFSLYQTNLCPTVMSLGENVAGIAREQIGVRYARGGSSPRSGFDCSGFVHWVFARHGVDVPRDTVRQSSAGHEVSRSSLLPGDILIFRISNTPNGRHSAIYIGNNRFIHSPRAGTRVRVERLSDSYWARHYYTARRVLKAPPCDLDLYSNPDFANTHTLAEEESSPYGVD